MYYSCLRGCNAKENKILDAMRDLFFDKNVVLESLTLGGRFELTVEYGAITLEQLINLSNRIGVRADELVAHHYANASVEYSTSVPCNETIMAELLNELKNRSAA